MVGDDKYSLKLGERLSQAELKVGKYADTDVNGGEDGCYTVLGHNGCGGIGENVGDGMDQDGEGIVARSWRVGVT